MMLVATHFLSLAMGVVIAGAYTRRQVAKRKAKADELRYILAVTIPHSPEDAIRRAGC